MAQGEASRKGRTLCRSPEVLAPNRKIISVTGTMIRTPNTLSRSWPTDNQEVHMKRVGDPCLLLRCMSQQGSDPLSEETWNLKPAVTGVVRSGFWLP